MPQEKTFNYQEDGLTYSVRVFQGEGGNYYAEITVAEGHADFNAIYWGDDTEGNSDFDGFSGRDSSLNMNGAGSRHNGKPVEWDGAQKISSPGFGPHSGEKTFLSAGETSEPILLEGLASLDDVEYLGIRATSTSTPEGSIKSVGTGEEEADPHCPDFLAEWGEEPIDYLVFYFDDGEDGMYSVKVEMAGYDQHEKGGLTDEQFEDCMQCLRQYLTDKDPELEFETALLGVSFTGFEDENGDVRTEYFLIEAEPGAFDGMGTPDDEIEEYDFALATDSPDGYQSYWNFVYWLETDHGCDQEAQNHYEDEQEEYLV
jgi:hypothetical protein